MTDQDDAERTPAVPSAGDERTVPRTLLGLQEIDTESDQLNHRLANSPLRGDLVAKSRQLTQWEARRVALRASIDTLGEAIAQAEIRDAELLAHKVRLEQQLRTVIAPREAEALMHEIATIDAQRDELDTKELEALEQQSEHEDELAGHLGLEESVREATRGADEFLGVEVAEIEATLSRLDERRTGLRSELAADILSTYDRKRAALGVAVAALVGRQCQGCHLELSAAEIDTVKDEAAATGVTDCPECGRLLIV